MARNEEKHVCRLNRYYLEKEREEKLKKNPPRPKLITLNTAEDIQKWLPSLKRDIDFNLKQSQVSCYPERKIKEFHGEIDRLEREYKAFVRKLRELNPDLKAVPWNERGYDGKKRPQPAEKDVQSKSSNSSTESDKVDIERFKSERIATPLLDSESCLIAESCPSVSYNIDTESQDKPLTFQPIGSNRGTSSGPFNTSVSPALKRFKYEDYKHLSRRSKVKNNQNSLQSYESSEVGKERVFKRTSQAGKSADVTGIIGSNPLGLSYDCSSSDSD